MKNIAFRVDASQEIGTGHVMRCLALADELKRRGAQIRFVSRHMPDHLEALLTLKGHEFKMVGGNQGDAVFDDLPHASWLGSSQRSDAKATLQALSGRSWDWLVVDHYALDIRWESALRQMVKNILAFDDIADRLHDCDVLLDQNLHADMNDRYADRVPTHCQLLLGPSYALLRPEFRKLREQTEPRGGPIRRVLVFFGGVDADDFTSRAIEALIDIGIPDLQVDVVIGAQHPRMVEIESECIRRGFVCHTQTDRMAELMAIADLAIGAGGTASWERCCLGLPAIIVSLADNQTDIATALNAAGGCVYIGPIETVTANVIRGAIVDLLGHQERFKQISEKSFSIVDGLGVDRLSQALNF